MPVPSPQLSPPFNIVRLSHVEYHVTDLASSRAFYVDTLGLQVSDETDTVLYLRAMEERGHHCIVLHQAEEASVSVLGFKVFDESDLERAESYFKEQGLPVEWVDKPYMGRTLKTRDPDGIPLEFYALMDKLPSLHQQYKLYNGVKPLRIDHANMFSANVDASVSFYNALGFRTTEYTEDNETGKVWAAWMHRKGGVHDIAFTNGRGPRFLYVLDPDGHRIEIYCSDYQTVDPDHEPIKWDLKDPQRQTLWGAAAPRSWFEKGSVFENASVKEPVLKAQPIIAP